jgi:hypothetical protein
MFTSSLHHHLPATHPATPVRIDGRSYPASQRNLVAASLLARPEKPRSGGGPLATWWRP